MKKLKYKSGLGLLAVVVGVSCSTPHDVQDAYTDDSNYFDYEYYDNDISHLDTFEPNYDYYYYEQEAPPVMLEEAEEREEKDSDDWFFEDY